MRGGRRGLTLVAMCLAQAMILLDVTIVNVALPSIQRELDLSPGGLEWVISAYALALATLIPWGAPSATGSGASGSSWPAWPSSLRHRPVARYRPPTSR